MSTAATTTTTPADQAERFARIARDRLEQRPDALREVREQAIERFLDLGLPTRRDEEWRASDPRPITQTPYREPRIGDVSAEQVEGFAIPDLDAHTLVFVDGAWSAERSDLGSLPEGVTVEPLSEAIGKRGEELARWFAAEGEPSSKALTAVNAALAEDGVFVCVEDGAKLDRPLRLLSIATDSNADEPPMVHSRNIIIAGRGAEATVIEQYVSLTDGVYWNNVVTQIEAGDGGRVDHYLIEQESPAACQVSTLVTEQGRQSDVRSHTALFGGKLVRNHVNPRLNGEFAHGLVNGLYVGSERQQFDNIMRVEHNSTDGDSRQFYKGVLRDRAHAVFAGRIRVEKGAQKTDAKQTNANLLLSENAEALAKPQLEIYADDVKCTHGATIGEIDEEAVFYLMARGVEKHTARGLMVYAFAAESLERMDLEPVRKMLAKMLVRRLPEGEKLETLVG
ncbi:MAG: Fe-S cluster assembly protein SufD [Phycisphaeraceae bacterium]